MPPEPPGLHRLDLGRGDDGLLYVPAGYRADVAAPLVVLLHGAGGDARGGIDPLLRFADESGVLLLAPASVGITWKVVFGSFGPDVASIDRGLAYVFARFAVDPEFVGIGGFSDGASYALSVGLTNGDLFTHVIAFSPGFSAPSHKTGRPAIYLTHGVEDRVLPIEFTSRRLRPRLEQFGYHVEYEEFYDGHVVPSDRAKRGLDWFLRAG
ncbi:phospholipase [Mycobacterium parmense]|nr:phospholipase [Mycobacterium parmense]